MVNLQISEDELMSSFMVEHSLDEYFDADGDFNDKGKIALYRYMEDITGIPADQRPSDAAVLEQIAKAVAS